MCPLDHHEKWHGRGSVMLYIRRRNHLGELSPRTSEIPPWDRNHTLAHSVRERDEGALGDAGKAGPGVTPSHTRLFLALSGDPGVDLCLLVAWLPNPTSRVRLYFPSSVRPAGTATFIDCRTTLVSFLLGFEAWGGVCLRPEKRIETRGFMIRKRVVVRLTWVKLL